jgi:hypothetical protein
VLSLEYYKNAILSISTADKKTSIITIMIRADIPEKYTVIIDEYSEVVLSTAEGSRKSGRSGGSGGSGGSRSKSKGTDEKTKKSSLISELFTFDCNEELYGIPNIVFDSTTTMPTDEFVKNCTNLSNFGGEDIRFQIDSDKFVFSMKSDSGDYTLTMINSQDNTDFNICINTRSSEGDAEDAEDAEDIEIDIEEDTGEDTGKNIIVEKPTPSSINGVLSYKILSSGFQIKQIADVVKIDISNEPSIPVKITANDAGDDGSCSFELYLYFSQKNFGEDDTGAGAGAGAE